MMHVAPQFAAAFRELGIDEDGVFSHELIVPWRQLSDRENCTLEHKSHRWHIKRYPATRSTTPAERELWGHRALVDARIASAELVAWGVLRDRRSFVIFDDLRDFAAADKLVAAGLPFDAILGPTADLAAALHAANLHHRDLYLCHFFAKAQSGAVEVRIIDAARVRKLPAFTRSRWITKDLAQFWYSTLALPVTNEQRDAWLRRYASRRPVADVESVRRAISRKVQSIARHDTRLNRRQPRRNISIPSANG
jgi:hypothetical protein